MRDLENDLAHIVFAMFVLWLPVSGIIGYVLAGAYIGLLIELKERNPNILSVLGKPVSWRDISGYAIGGLIIGLILR